MKVGPLTVVAIAVVAGGLGVLASLFVAGVLAADRTGRALGVSDHGGIVWDEMVAMWLVLAFTPPTLLWQAVAAQPQAQTCLGHTVQGWAQEGDGVALQLSHGATASGRLLLGCDGLWSRVRVPLLGDTLPVPTGHIAYRGLVDQSGLPAAQRQGWRLPYLTLRRGILGEQAWLAWADEVALALKA